MTNPASELTLPDPSFAAGTSSNDTADKTDVSGADASLSMLDGQIQGWETFITSQLGHGEPRRSESRSGEQGPSEQGSSEQGPGEQRPSKTGLRPKCAAHLFGTAADGGQVYRWGVAVADGGPCDDVTQMVTRRACDAKLRKRDRAVDLIAAVDFAIASFNDPSTPSVKTAASAVRWAAAVDRVLPLLEVTHAHRLVRSLLELHEAIASRAAFDCPLHLIVVGELGLTLAWRLPELAAAAKLRDGSVEAVAQWCGGEDDSVAAAIEGATNARLVLASILRCNLLVGKEVARAENKEEISNRSNSIQQRGPGIETFDQEHWRRFGDLGGLDDSVRRGVGV